MFKTQHLFFIILSGLALLMHSIIPHHMESDGSLCFVSFVQENHTDNCCEEDVKDISSHHSHDSEDCFFDTDIISNTQNNTIVKVKVIELYQLAYNNLIIEDSPSEHIKTSSTDPNKHLISYQAHYIISAIGFRAPPEYIIFS